MVEGHWRIANEELEKIGQFCQDTPSVMYIAPLRYAMLNIATVSLTAVF